VTLKLVSEHLDTTDFFFSAASSVW